MRPQQNHDSRNERTQCEELLESYKRAYDAYQDARIHYEHQEQSWQEQQKKENGDPTADAVRGLREKQAQLFRDSQFIEWQGQPYNCERNTSTWHCTSLSSDAHEKCKCQQLYGNRSHLNAPCNPSAALFADPLTYERCLAKGYLDNHGIEAGMCVHHIGKEIPTQASSNSPRNVAEWSACPLSAAGQVPMERPVPPELKFPVNTCVACANEFGRLEQKFSYENLAAVSQCIAGIGADDHRVPETYQLVANNDKVEHIAGKRQVEPSRHQRERPQGKQQNLQSLRTAHKPRKHVPHHLADRRGSPIQAAHKTDTRSKQTRSVIPISKPSVTSTTPAASSVAPPNVYPSPIPNPQLTSSANLNATPRMTSRYDSSVPGTAPPNPLGFAQTSAPLRSTYPSIVPRINSLSSNGKIDHAGINTKNETLNTNIKTHLSVPTTSATSAVIKAVIIAAVFILAAYLLIRSFSSIKCPLQSGTNNRA